MLKLKVCRDQIESVQSIRISSSNRAISGEFRIGADNSAELKDPDNHVAMLTVAYQDAVAIDDAGKEFYIAIPPQTYRSLKIEIAPSESDFTNSITTKTDVDVLIQRNTIYPITFVDNTYSDGVLPGSFSVSDTRKVRFSQGNLFWDGTKFKFEANQYNFQNPWSASHVNLFFWSKTASVAYAASYSDNPESGDDVFFTNQSGFTVNVCGREQAGWRTLTKEEWKYLFETRTNATNIVVKSCQRNYGFAVRLVKE